MIRTVSEWTGYPGSPYYTTIYFGGSTEGEAIAAANAVTALWATLDGFLHVGATINVQDDVPQVDPATGQIIQNFVVTTAATVTTVVGEPLPPSNQALVRLRTGDYVAGRELRGRVFIPCQLETGSLNGSLTVGWMGALDDAFEQLAVTASGAGGLVVWSPTHGVASNVTSISVWDQFAILRSRRD